MSIVFNELTQKFMQLKYPMSSGSDEWVDIKTDFELEDDAIMGTVSKVDNSRGLEIDKVSQFKSELEAFQIRVNNYIPKDDLESKEKVILEEKVDSGLQIYSSILDKKN